MASKRKEGYWKVYWYWTGANTRKLQRSKQFTESAYAEMTDFMTDKIELLGMHKVWLVKFDRRGRQVYSSAPNKRAKIDSKYNEPLPDRGCDNVIAENLEDEDFGTFAGIPG